MSTNARDDSKVTDIYQRVVKFIDDNEIQPAVHLIQQQNASTQLDLIHKLALVLARDRDLAGALALSFDLVSARDLADELTEEGVLTLDRNLDLTLTLTLGLANALGDILDHDLAGAMADSHARDRDLNMMNIIRSVIEGLLDITSLHLVPLNPTESSDDALTADSLETQIVPYTRALTDLQRTIAEIKQKEFEPPIILKIEAGSYTIIWRNLWAEVSQILRKVETWRTENEALLTEVITYQHKVAESRQKGEIPPANLIEEGQAVKNQLDEQAEGLVNTLVQELKLNPTGAKKDDYLKNLKEALTILTQHEYGSEMSDL